MSLALLFPGQGAQYVGMGRALAAAFSPARETFEEADDILGVRLTRLMWEGPEDELVLTMNAQPAILAHSIAVLRLAEPDLGPPSMAAGHSLGEYSAHVAAGTLGFAEALRTVRLRGRLMGEAGQSRPGTMSAVLGLDDGDVLKICEDAAAESAAVVVPANLNAPGQVVISGDVDGVVHAESLSKERGARRVIRLGVSGAFHSPLMRDAEKGLRAELESARLGRPRFPVYANVDARPVSDARTARDTLVRQLTRPVRWSESVRAMVAAGAGHFVELGPGRVLAGLNRRNARGMACRSAGEPDDLRRLGATG